MTSQQDQSLHLLSLDRDLLYLNADEQQRLGLITLKEQKQLGKMIKKVHRHIQKATTAARTTAATQISSTSVSTASQVESQEPYGRRGTTALVEEFYQRKQTKQLYAKLRLLRDQYDRMMKQRQIRELESDMERFQLLQVIHGLSSRLDVSSQLYDELHHLKRSLYSLRREWKLDGIQQIVKTIATTPSSPTSSSVSRSSVVSMTTHHGHRWHPLVTMTTSSSLSSSQSSSSSLSPKTHSHFEFVHRIKNWFRHSTSIHSSKMKPSAPVTQQGITTGSSSSLSLPLPPIQPPTSRFSGKQNHRRRPQTHAHLVCASQEECRTKVIQLAQDFQNVFEENARQNEQRMHLLYARVFQHDVDPLLAEDIQRLCLAVSAAPPPSLASLMQPGLSSNRSWSLCVTSDTIWDSFLLPTGNDDNNYHHDVFEKMILPLRLDPHHHHNQNHNHRHQQHHSTEYDRHQGDHPQPSSSQQVSPSTATIATPLSSASYLPASRGNHDGKIKERKDWFASVWKRRNNKTTKQASSSPISTSSSSSPVPSVTSSTKQRHQDQQVTENTGLMLFHSPQQQAWSICLGLLSEHLLIVGQQYYTRWIQEIRVAQRQQTTPFQVATETLASMYQALQIEQGYAILSRLCAQMESHL